VNPVDAKIRAGSGPGSPRSKAKVLGWDATGVVAAVGAEGTLFAPRFITQARWIAAAPTPNTILVDERLVGHKPASIGFAEAAAPPLTTLTEWEMSFDWLKIRIGKPVEARSILIVGGVGGVCSISTL
jgi:NADPH2:quinone reductase